MRRKAPAAGPRATRTKLSLAEARHDAWLDENRDAIDAYNAHVSEHGVFSDDWRRF